jgi:hypothetical protein
MIKCFEFSALALRAGASLLVVSFVNFAVPILAQERATDSPPVQRVVVYDTGVAFIEHEGKVTGSKELILDLPDRDVNDLLKSMVAQDLGGGRVSWAALPTSTSKAPPVQLANRKDLTDLLLAMKGMRIRIGAGAPVEGELLLVENRTIEKTKEIVPQATILTDSGIVRIDVKNGDSVQLTDRPQRQAMTRSAQLLDSTADHSATTIRLQCEGEGERRVRVGYVAAMPIWKASYRLVLGEKGSTLLQAWALVENATQNDWRDVECTLVSGRGLGFQTDLRTPLTIKRPYRAPQRFAMIAPDIHKPSEPSRLASQSPFPGNEENSTDSLDFAPRGGGMGGGMGGMGLGGMGGMAAGGMGGMGGSSAGGSTEMGDLLNRRLEKWREQSQRANSSVAQAAQPGVLDSASAIGESVRYQLKGKISVDKGETALLHLTDAKLEGQELSIFNPSTDTRHPLHAIQVANPTTGALAAGPVSIFSGDAYRGDALVDHWPAGEKRIISYAIDTQVNVRWESEETPLEYLGVFVAEDIGDVIFVARESLKGAYQIENRSDAQKTVWIEHPRFHDWSLSEPKSVAETSVDRYRIEQVMQPQKEATIPVSLTRYRLMWPEEVALRMSDKEIAASSMFTESVQRLLQIEAALKAEEASLQNREYEVELQLEEIAADQERLRETIKTLEKFPAQATPFLEKLLALEAQLGDLRTESKRINRYLDGEIDTAIDTEASKKYVAERGKLLPAIQSENPIEKLPYKPTAKEIRAWRERRYNHRLGTGGGMGGFF